ncbi:MAG: glycine C-acetyltransferase [Cyanobacteria bacterium]|nr:glycine C-acetyltransferase [Cyanobacteriota bacterium]MDA1020003.1 glycine C-acetyltransferase [Cyanobacteriota bacterium]
MVNKIEKEAISIVNQELEAIKAKGIYKTERLISSAQGREIETIAADQSQKTFLNLCANNYLGLGGSQELIDFAKEGLDRYGFGLNSVRFICGTQTIHRELEQKVAEFVGCQDAVLYSSCFDANGGLFETLLNKEDVIISDKLNHASIIDGIRLCKAERKLYDNNDMEQLETLLQESETSRIRLIVTDGVFSMDGVIANLSKIVELAEKYNALVMVDDSHATGFVGKTGRGTAEHCDVFGKIDIITGTFGKALGGASGGFTACHSSIADLLRQRSRPYLFSNSLAPAIVWTEIKVLEMLNKGSELIAQVQANSKYLREKLTEAGIDIVPGEHPIIPVMIYDEVKAIAVAEKLYQEGIYVVGFCYPVVPLGKARIRVQVSAIHRREDLDRLVAALKKYL